MATRNYTISIMKGLAIILMVIGHAEAPWYVTNFIYTFHMPLFFIAAGYFFSRKYLDNPWNFISKRVKGLYFPFLKWALVFLVLHNVFFHFGILNEAYGNWEGGVTHPYSWKIFWQRMVNIFTTMSGYDEFMAGAFWFFRGLMVASILYLLLYKLIDSRSNLTETRAAGLICIGAIAFTAFHIASDSKIGIPNGGWRETWGLFFFGIGVLYRHYEQKIRENWMLFAVYFLLLCGAALLRLSGMNNRGIYRDLWSLPLTGCIGWLMVHFAATKINAQDSRLRSLLVFIGENTLYVFIFHIISFKAVSLLKIWWYDLDPLQIGCHMVIHHNNTDIFWVLYSIAGVSLPLIGLSIYRRLHQPIRTRSQQLLKSIRTPQ
ncbi:MAG: acyltransferase family protein [Clostridium sp.]|nr:acyltransferase family protein [Prevotella sp.]MCM1429445.1 acyltransferase family protein [Clostridium sp.]MCM1475520.1 acyltransferase family protein [Muribaculaceae bacterium]